MLFGLSGRNSGQYYAMDAKTGKTLWTSDGRQAAHASVARAGDLLFSLESDGELVVARSSATAFEPLRKYKVSANETWAQPAISGNRVFVKDVTSLDALVVELTVVGNLDDPLRRLDRRRRPGRLNSSQAASSWRAGTSSSPIAPAFRATRCAPDG